MYGAGHQATPVLAAIRELFQQGAVVSGTSAGCSCQSDRVMVESEYIHKLTLAHIYTETRIITYTNIHTRIHTHKYARAQTSRQTHRQIQFGGATFSQTVTINVQFIQGLAQTHKQSDRHTDRYNFENSQFRDDKSFIY